MENYTQHLKPGCAAHGLSVLWLNQELEGTMRPGATAAVTFVLLVGTMHGLTVARSEQCVGCRESFDASIQLVQQRPTEARLRTAIEELRNGTPNYDQMEPMLRAAVRQQLPTVQARLINLGRLISLQYEGQQQGADVYGARFEGGSTVWMIGLSPDGKLAALWFQ